MNFGVDEERKVHKIMFWIIIIIALFDLASILEELCQKVYFKKLIDNQKYYEAINLLFHNGKIWSPIDEHDLDQIDDDKFQQFIYCLYDYIKQKSINETKDENIESFTTVNKKNFSELAVNLYQATIFGEERIEKFLYEYFQDNLYSINKIRDRNINFCLFYLELLEKGYVVKAPEIKFKDIFNEKYENYTGIILDI